MATTPHRAPRLPRPPRPARAPRLPKQRRVSGREVRRQKDNIHRILQGIEPDEGGQAVASVACGCGPVCSELYAQMAGACTLREEGDGREEDEVLDGGLAHVWGYGSLQHTAREGRSICGGCLLHVLEC